ncbi:MAG: cupredoxin domain-containing protein [Candidatus Eremiobacteraeota bacterium]|nr:cupredoxin domain-containing protein [Candidatus Eremiobacteraeota bacterium]MBV8263274.1 cupredoxin domain-containing protein [Candidatus Eremiobacteraeota bacterium]MBV8339088.1 cupredoxin domain-containing protein [Candidatus Eremiobacteraeota bacterium]MBV8459286.1 cupredoxin domain-containing protein [Candidatus Eremiobacteraeota bacterium]MBV8596221.1 cupredoxin domain-containing protein [Candidatus Eremiobacteraeota bacterium]
MHQAFRATVLPLAIAAVALVISAGAALAHPTIDIVASNWKFTPAKISIPVNEETTLRLTSSSGVHGIASDDLGIATTKITPGDFQLVKFTPKKAGTYVLHCAVVCGPGHSDMALTIEVTP